MVRTRFAPSPTGFLHIGSLRTALYAYVMVKHDNGQFILRVEDTDQKREIAGSLESLINTLKFFGLNWDEYYLQSERLEIYKKAALKLLADNNAFYCQCPPRNAKQDGFSQILRDPCHNKNLNSGAIKLKVPDSETVSYFDFVHKKEISWDTNGVYDATLLKSDGFPTYHLAAMVDDLDMKITHILRGHDWMPSTPIHLLVFKFLGGTRPEIGHLSDILNAQTGKKLSKRRDSVYVEDFVKEGYLPEALLNFVMLLGWAPKDNRELYTLDEFVKEFDSNGFQEANPKFEDKKLKWFNGYYLRLKTDDQLFSLIKPFLQYPCSDGLLQKIIPLVKERITFPKDINDIAKFFFVRPEAVPSLSQDFLQNALVVLQNCEWNKADIESKLAKQVELKAFHRGNFYMDLRLAICGQKITPPLTESMLILGSDEVILRIKNCKF